MKRLLLSGLCTMLCLCLSSYANAQLASASDEFQRAISPLYSLHTSEVLFLSPQKVSQKSLTKVAQVCWIMDTGECLGNEFGWSDDTPGGGAGPTDEFDEKGPEDCIKEGYTLTSCPEGKGPNKVCMYDNRYFEYL